ncbi:hypothetical protein IMG5_204300 [Ichthyophthirius multifiliis]|uniref:Uncharacterized protein n=1 Tax=Ichthyophthirius multifiliis TaxID=5932 RepID=G0R6H2_ICHMU|nr:hypothetical protein IMG5_204300 [Ichthyophthirius multifiliis]EGR26928.1 hypothetical protein IMG5_204300 [Ichthyophthirius multifiliis]|eukprot:XP_004023812.1 hypothetical protein IMG5_204300 [Ichthyophthirius multifiliis]
MISNNIQQKFEKLIKIRIGEPITAVQIHQDLVIVGSISGYVGIYNIQNSQLQYIQEVYEEIIRGVQNINYLQIQIFLKKIRNYLFKKKDTQSIYKHIFENHRDKKTNICASTISFLNKNTAAMTLATPTQNKDAIFDYKNSPLKGILQVYCIEKQEWKNYEQLNIPNISVPFDYDGQQFIWLEYKEQMKKIISVYNLQTQTTNDLITFDKNIEFISHVKLAKNFFIFVQDHKHVKVILFKFNLFFLKKLNLQRHLIQKINFFNQKVVKEINVLKYIFKLYLIFILIFLYIRLQNTPDQLIKHKYIFDMGYPYYIQVNDNTLAFSCDFGVCVIKI